MEVLEDYMNGNTVIKDDVYKKIEYSIFCLICKDLIIDPIMCSECKNVFCKKCIENWARKNKKCPIKCNSNFIKCRDKAEILRKLKFECKKCKNEINYDDMPMHFYSNCNTKKINTDYYNNRSSSTGGIFEKIENKKFFNRCIKLKSKKKLIFIISFYYFSSMHRYFWCW